MEGEPSAAELLDFLGCLPQLGPADKRSTLRLLTAGLPADGGRVDLVARSGHASGCVSVFRTAGCSAAAKSRIFRVTGCGEVAAPPAHVFELLANLELMPEWDMLFKEATYLSYDRDPAGRCDVATIHLVYGLPGVSRFVSDRDFLLRVVRVNFPHGLHVLACHSLPPDEVVPGDPGPSLPHTIRGHMWESGYVVVPTSSGCCLNVTLQVDPKGWIPTSVVNWSLEAIPLNIPRLRAALARLDPALLALLPDMNARQAAAARNAPAGRQPCAATMGSAALRLFPSAPQQQRRAGVRGCGSGSGSGSCSPTTSSASSSNSQGEAGAAAAPYEEETSEWFDA